MTDNFYKRCKDIIKGLELTEEQSIARECILFSLECYEEECKEYLNRIIEAVKYLEEPNRDKYDFSKAKLLEILQGEENE